MKHTCAECGLPIWSFIHYPNHPANVGKSTHEFEASPSLIPIYLGLVGSLLSLTGSAILLIGLLIGDIQ